MAGSCLDVRFVSPAPVPPGNAGLQPGSRSHAGAWRSQGKLWRTGSVFMKQTSSSALLVLFTPVSGWASDRIDARYLMILGYLFYAVFGLYMTFADLRLSAGS